MASMEDLISTLSDVHAGQKGNDLRDLRVSIPARRSDALLLTSQAKLTQTLQPSFPSFRPVPPPTNPYAIGDNAAAGPMPPPAPVSSWNSPPPMGAYLGHGTSPVAGPSGSGAGASNGFARGSPSYHTGLGQGTSPRQGPYFLQPQQRELGFRPEQWTENKSASAGKQKDDSGTASAARFQAASSSSSPQKLVDRQTPRADNTKSYRRNGDSLDNSEAMDTGDYADDPFSTSLYNSASPPNRNDPGGRR